MTDRPRLERELKFPAEDLDRLRVRLQEMEAESLGPAAFEDNWIFDRNGSLQRAGCLLRLRKNGQRTWLTFKGPMRFEGRTRVREEHETAVGNHDETRALLEGLGYQVVRRYQKVREEWQVGGVRVSLDHTPIGDFVEFEGEAAEALARRLGFDPARAERRTYLRLYEDYRKEHPDAPPDMLFQQ